MDMSGSFFTSMPIAIAAGGAIGAVSRHYLGSFIMRFSQGGFPLGTLLVNGLGAFLMGLLVELLALKFSLSPSLRGFLLVGLLGGFTTFSTYSLEMALLIERHQMLQAGLYAVLSFGLTLAGVFAGLYAGRFLA
ncbi:putative fluoride ion transporter CrcB [Iodidimonas nitroreducens]|uniref:Fluoride-specific ion channel FluC n=2 Tax=Iodidimonas nitroreducens TaxID=1236968 RepID=A0A5A7N6B2_9PROT|nr:putative fluoride ion transporter CrcB [Iodidimonas nitroreducens]